MKNAKYIPASQIDTQKLCSLIPSIIKIMSTTSISAIKWDGPMAGNFADDLEHCQTKEMVLATFYEYCNNDRDAQLWVGILSNILNP